MKATLLSPQWAQLVFEQLPIQDEAMGVARSAPQGAKEGSKEVKDYTNSAFDQYSFYPKSDLGLSIPSHIIYHIVFFLCKINGGRGLEFSLPCRQSRPGFYNLNKQSITDISQATCFHNEFHLKM